MKHTKKIQHKVELSEEDFLHIVGRHVSEDIPIGATTEVETAGPLGTIVGFKIAWTSKTEADDQCTF